MQIRKKGGMKLKKISSETTEAISRIQDVLTDTILKGDHLRIISAKYS
jgi:hypothetical protein